MINFVLTDSKNYLGVQKQILDEIKSHLPRSSWLETVDEYIDGHINFTLFIDKEADVLMSHGAADKNYHWRKIAGDKNRRLNHERRRSHLLVPGPWLKNRIVNSKYLDFSHDQVHVVGWPRLDILIRKQEKWVADRGADSRKKVLWAPTHDYARRGSDEVSMSSYPEFEPYLEEMRDNYDVAVSLHPRNRKEKTPTDMPLIEADVVISDFGTIVYEAIALGKQVIFPSWIIRDRILSYLSSSAEHEIFSKRYGCHADSFDHLIELIDGNYQPDQESSRFFNDYLEPGNYGKSAKTIADLLLKLDQTRESSKYLNNSNSMRVKMNARDIADGIDKWLGKSRGGYDFWKIGRLVAAADSAEFFQENMSTTPLYKSKLDLHRAVFSKVTIQGLILEFGVAGGRSINRIAGAFPSVKIYGFDSFEGLPEAWRSDYQQGTFAQNIPGVNSNVELIQGWFEDTLPDFLASHNGDVSLLHIDCDLYSSTKTVLDALSDRIVPGTVILFDEFFNYPGWRKHEYKAFNEFVNENAVIFDYIAATRSNKQVAVVIKSIGKA